MSTTLPLHQEILLLALRDREGDSHGGMVAHALAGAGLAELLLQSRIEIREERKKQFVELRDGSPTGDAVLDAFLKKISEARRRAQLRAWVGRLAGTRELLHDTARALCRQGILRADEKSVLLFFRKRIYPEVDPRPEREMGTRMRMAIFSDAGDVDPRTTILVSLANATGILRYVFDRKELKSRRTRLEAIARGDMTSKATQEAVAAAQAAAAMAAILPAMMVVTTTAHH